jgi:hypothetical protein
VNAPAPQARPPAPTSRLALAHAVVGVLVGVLCSVASAQPMPASAVHPRPGTPIPDGTVTSLTPQEIVVRPNDPAEPLHRYGWHEIQSISPLSEDLRQAFEIGRRIWHSDLRLSRGDWTSAEALLEPLEPTMHSEQGPTALAFYHALLRVRLARMDRPAAARAWLSLRAAGDTDAPVNPELGPFYFRLSQVAPLTESESLARTHAAAMAWATSPAAGPTTGPTTEHAALADEIDQLLDASSADPEARLLALCLAAYAGSTDTQTLARDELAPLALSDETYRGVWARYAIARALTLDTEPGRVRLGIAGLIEVSLRDDTTAPLLAGLALAEAANAANRIKDPRTARVLAAELGRRFPAHPAQRTIPVSLSPLQSTPETTP